MRRVEGGGVADLTWCSLLFRAFLYARFTSERGSWVDLGIGSRAGQQVCEFCTVFLREMGGAS